MYNLDVIISVGYRVKSKNGVIFRKWATKVLKDYMIKGYAVNQKRLEYLEKTIKLIENSHPNACIIVVDAALSKKENVGKIFVKKEKTVLGRGLNKNKIELGDLSIKAVVGKNNKLPYYNFNILQNVPLNTVIKLANVVADGIVEIVKYG